VVIKLPISFGWWVKQNLTERFEIIGVNVILSEMYDPIIWRLLGVLHALLWAKNILMGPSASVCRVFPTEVGNLAWLGGHCCALLTPDQISAKMTCYMALRTPLECQCTPKSTQFQPCLLWTLSTAGIVIALVTLIILVWINCETGGLLSNVGIAPKNRPRSPSNSLRTYHLL
jgi:hypothetical protein